MQPGANSLQANYPGARVMKPSFRSSLSLLLFIALSGCANLQAVREFALVSSASAEYTELVSDYAASPLRQKEFQPERTHASLDQMAVVREAQKTDLLAIHTLIAEYMDSLGHLAADEIVVFDREYDLFASELRNSEILGAKEVDAYARIAKILTSAAADGWRKRKLAKIIGETNDDFQIVAGALSLIVDKDFRASLENEKIAVAKHYGGIIAEAKANPPQGAGIAAVIEIMKERLASVDSGIEAIDTYTAILQKIAAGHQQLYDGRKCLAKKALFKDLKRQSKELRKAYKELRSI